MDLTGGTLFHLGSYQPEKDGAFEVLHRTDHQHRFNPVHAEASSAASACAWSA